jgi:hypothetical protein
MDSELEAEEKQRKADKYCSIHFHIAEERQVRVNFDSKTAQTKATTQNPKDIPPKLQLGPSGDWDESGNPQPITQNEPTGDGSKKGEMAVPSRDRNSSGKHRSILRNKSDACIGNGGTEGIMQKISRGEWSEDQGDWDESVNREQVVHTRSTGDRSDWDESVNHHVGQKRSTESDWDENVNWDLEDDGRETREQASREQKERHGPAKLAKPTLLKSKQTARVAVTIAANPLTTALALLGASPMIRQLTMKVERARNVTTIVKPSPYPTN